MEKKDAIEIKTRIIHQKQKNGDIYVIERKTQYDPIKKYNKVLSSKLISKIPKGESEPVQTRPKRPYKIKVEEKSDLLEATREHVGMMDIIEHIGKVSKIDEAIYNSTDLATAQKIISVARYLLATDGQTLPGIATWQYNHKLPYEEGISEDIYHDLFVNVGRDESLQQNFFKERCRGLNDKDAVAYDSTTISTYSSGQSDARYGFNKASDGLKTVKLLSLYSIESRQPIAFTKQPGNLSDVMSVTNAINQLSALDVKATEIITDNGYYSEANLSELLQAKYNFITLIKTNISWVKPQIDLCREELENIKTMCPYDSKIHGKTVMLKHDFKKTRKYSSQKKDIKKGEVEPFSRRIYLHIYYSATRQNDERVEFEKDLWNIKNLLETGTGVDELSEKAQKYVTKYLIVKNRGKKVIVDFKDNEIKEAYKYHGYFVLISSKENDTFECLRKYRKRGTIESFFRTEKQRVDGSRIRVWDSDTLRGRMFVQFVALCYYEYLGEEIRKLKSTLGKETGDSEHDKKAILDEEKKLKSWLEKTPLYLQLQWFDTIESVKISSRLKNKRCTTEMTNRDQLYLQKLGMH